MIPRLSGHFSLFGLQNHAVLYLQPRGEGGGGGGDSGFQVTGRIECAKTKNPKESLGVQTNPKKIAGPKFNHQKIPSRISEP